METGRKSDEKDDTPSALANTVQKLITEISEAIRNSLVGLFRDYQGEDLKTENGVQNEEEEEEEEEEETRGINGGEGYCNCKLYVSN